MALWWWKRANWLIFQADKRCVRKRLKLTQPIHWEYLRDGLKIIRSGRDLPSSTMSYVSWANTTKCHNPGIFEMCPGYTIFWFWCLLLHGTKRPVYARFLCCCALRSLCLLFVLEIRRLLDFAAPLVRFGFKNSYLKSYGAPKWRVLIIFSLVCLYLGATSILILPRKTSKWRFRLDPPTQCSKRQVWQ